MAFGLFKNPFEKLSQENQATMIEMLEGINESLGEGGVAYSMLASINNNQIQTNTLLGNIYTAIKESSTISSKKAQEDLKELGNTAVVLGDGIQKIVEAIKLYSELDEDAVDRFMRDFQKIIDGIKKVSKDVQKIGKAMEQASAFLMNMASGIFWFGVALLISCPIYLLALPLAPIIIGVILGLTWLFAKVLNGAGKDIEHGAKALSYLALAIFLVGVSLYLSGLVYAELWKGFVGMIAILLTITLLVGIMWLIDGLSKSIKDGVKSLLWMTVVVAIVGVTLYLASFVYAELWKGFGGMVAILLTIGALVGLMWLIDKLSSDIYDGVKALALMVLVVALTGVILYLAGKFYDELYDGLIASWPLLVVIGALIGLMFFIDMMDSTIYDGVKALVAMVLSLYLVAGVLLLASKYGDELQAGLGASWPLLIVIGALVGVMFLISLIKNQVLKGSLALIAVSAAVVILAGGLMVFKASGFTVGDGLVLAATLAVLALVGTILGITPIWTFALIGAGVMVAISVALVPITMSLMYFKNSGFGWKDLGLFAAVIGTFAGTFTLIGNPFTSWMTAIGGITMIGVGAALVLITNSLMTFKKSGFNTKDMEVLDKIIYSMAASFATVSKGGRDAKGRKTWSMYDVQRGIYALLGIGRVTSDLARGVQEWANLTVTEWEYDEAKGRLVPARKVKLDDKDFKNVSIGMGLVLGAIAEPLAKVGMADAGVGSGLWAQMFAGKGYVKRGITALRGVGGVLSGLAQGVKDFANLAFWEYGLKKQSDGTEKLVPVKQTKLSDLDIELAGIQMETVLGVAAKAFAKVGMWEAAGEGWFSNGYVSKGINALKGVGGILKEIAGGVKRFAKMQFVEYTVGKDKDGNPKLVPDKVIQLGPLDILKAELNMLLTVGAVARVFQLVGMWEASGEGWFSGGYISKGIKALSGIGGVLSGIANGVRQFASFEFTEYEVKNGKLVPGKRTKLTDGHIKNAQANIKAVLTAMILPIAEWYQYTYRDKISKMGGGLAMDVVFKERIPMLLTGVTSIAKTMKETSDVLLKVKDLDKMQAKVEMFLNAWTIPMGVLAKEINNLGVFAKHINLLGKNYREIDKIAKSFENIAGSMHEFKDGINDIDLELLSETRGLFEAMGVVAKAGSTSELIARFGDSLNVTFERLAELIANFSDEVKKNQENQNKNQQEQNKNLNNVLKNQQKNAENQPPLANAQNGAVVAGLSEIASLLRSGIKVKSNGGILNWGS